VQNTSMELLFERWRNTR